MKLSEIIAKAFGPATGPFGFPMLDQVAKDVDTLLKTIPKECKDVGFQRVVTCEKAGEFDDGERSDVSYITTDSLDRDREVLDPKGADWSQFKKNPIVPFGHEYRCLPVGRAAWWKRQSQKIKDRDVAGWIGKTIYSSKPDSWSADWFPDAVWHMVRTGVIKGKSIGFIPTEMRACTPKEIEERPELADCRRVFSKYLVLEWSVAPVQSNPDAIVDEVAKMKQKGMKLPTEFLDEMGIFLPDEPEPIDWNAFEERERKEKSAPAPVVKNDPIQMLTLSELRKSIEKQVADRLATMDAETMIKEAMARRSGRI